MNTEPQANNAPVEPPAKTYKEAMSRAAVKAHYQDEVRGLDSALRTFLQQIADLLTFANLLNAIKQSEAYSTTEPAAGPREDILTRAFYFLMVRAINIGPVYSLGGRVEYIASLHHKSLLTHTAYGSTFTLVTPTNTGDLLKTAVEKQGRNVMYVAHVDAAKGTIEQVVERAVDVEPMSPLSALAAGYRGPSQSTADVDRSEVTAKPETLWDTGHIQATLDQVAADRAERCNRLGIEIATHRDLGKLSLPTPLLFDREAAGLDLKPMPNNPVDRAVKAALEEVPKVYRYSPGNRDKAIAEAKADQEQAFLRANVEIEGVELTDAEKALLHPYTKPTQNELDELRRRREEQARALLEPHKIKLNPHMLGLDLRPIDVNTLATQGELGTCRGYSSSPPVGATGNSYAEGRINQRRLSAILGSTFAGQEEDDDTLELEVAGLTDAEKTLLHSPTALEALDRQLGIISTEAAAVTVDAELQAELDDCIRRAGAIVATLKNQQEGPKT